MKSSQFLPLITMMTIACLSVAQADQHGGHKTRHQPSISVLGTGLVSAAPDQVEFQVGATTAAPTASVAMEENNAVVEKIQAVLTRFQIAEHERQTLRFDVSPEYKQRRDAQEAPKVVGYRVQHVLSVTLSDINQLGKVLDELIRGGSNVLHGIQFSIANPEPLYSKARTQAVLNAQTKAGELALAAGVKLGSLKRLTEHGNGGVSPVVMKSAAMEMRAASVPISAGEHTIRVDVSAEYLILD